MKKFIICFLITTVLYKITSAQIDTAVKILKPIVKNSGYYLEKKSNFNKGGAVFGVLTIGTFVVTGIATNQSEGLDGLDILSVGAIVGIVCTAGTLLCLIGAEKNKKKAKLLLKEEQVSISSKTGLRLHSAGIRINF